MQRFLCQFFAELIISSTCPLPFLCIPFSKRKNQRQKDKKGSCTSGRVGSGQVTESPVRADSAGSATKCAAASACHGQQQLLSCSLARSLARSLSIPLQLELSLPFASSSPVLCRPCFPLCVLTIFFLSLCLRLERVYASVFSAVFVVVNLVCCSRRSTVSGIDSVLPFSMPVASFVASMRVDDQLLLFLFLSHVVVTVVQQFHVQTCSALY